KLPPELALFYERIRGQAVQGISSYSLHWASGDILLSSIEQLVVYRNGNSHKIAEYAPGALMSPTFSETDPNYVAFCSRNQLFVDRNGSQVFGTEGRADGNIQNGVSSFVEQEELERFEGFWWSPKRVELLYQRVDETPVARLTFVVPGKPPEDPMPYPLAGTANPITTLRLVSIDPESGAPIDKALHADLRKVVPWFEYIARVGWTADGEYVHLQLMDRQQNKLALVAVPRTAFISDNESGMQPTAEDSIRVLFDENSPVWINANNSTVFLPNSGDGKVRAIIASEKTNTCHLFLHEYDLSATSNAILSKETPLTAGEDWTVMKDIKPTVDTTRSLIYYLSNVVSPVIVSLCVSSFAAPGECRVLTPQNMSYKYDRGRTALSINPEIGFVCWLSNVSMLPECRFYRLEYSATDPLPTAVLQYVLDVSKPSPSATMPAPLEPSAQFRPKFYTYRSVGSGQTHYALLLLPPQEAPKGTRYPVVQHVYAGPCVQVVRDNWPSVANFIKYTTYGYAVLLVDGRGSHNRGVAFEGPIKNQMGTVEVADQVEGLKHVLNECHELDPDKVVVTGWSYGGYMALCMLIRHPEIYKASCGGAAVVDWRLYDTCYTERYLGMPQENERAYWESGVISRLKDLVEEEGRLLIVHGLIDENVHFLHSERLINALISNGKPHRLLLLPNERHGVKGTETIEYIHATLFAFFDAAIQRSSTH
ncbi:CBR-DPF-3 protein, partial [Aphelenchoides avenae]